MAVEVLPRQAFWFKIPPECGRTGAGGRSAEVPDTAAIMPDVEN
jgi:hypothetical protein